MSLRHTYRINDLKMTPDGHYFISCSNDYCKGLGNNIHAMYCRFYKHNSDVVCVDISLDGKIGVSGGYDNVIYVWDILA